MHSAPTSILLSLPAKDAHSDEHAQSDCAQCERQQANPGISSGSQVSAGSLLAPASNGAGLFIRLVHVADCSAHL